MCNPDKLVRLPGVAPGHSPWRGDILLLNHRGMESKGAGSVLFHTPGPRHFNKEQTPLAIWLDTNPRFHGGSFGVLGHTSCEALRL